MNETTRKCYWWNQWWHRRLRRMDEETMLPAIEAAAARRGVTDRDEIDSAWARFQCSPGQEHWTCECGINEV